MSYRANTLGVLWPANHADKPGFDRGCNTSGRAPNRNSEVSRRYWLTADVRASYRDWNLVLAKQSREFVHDLQCNIPMPTPPPLSQVPVLSVCDKLKRADGGGP